MSMKRPWYKRYPDHFIAGTLHLSFEERAAYSMLIDLAHGGERTIPNDDRMISTALGIRIQRWKRLKSSLNLAGKLKESSKNLSISPSQVIENVESGFQNKNKNKNKRGPLYPPSYERRNGHGRKRDGFAEAVAYLDALDKSEGSDGSNLPN